jgi:hypothetical protein
MKFYFNGGNFYDVKNENYKFSAVRKSKKDLLYVVKDNNNGVMGSNGSVYEISEDFEKATKIKDGIGRNPGYGISDPKVVILNNKLKSELMLAIIKKFI